MSTRIVERELSWCQSEVVGFLSKSGYRLDSTDLGDELLRGRYVEQDKKGMLYRPLVRVYLTSISNEITRVAVSFPGRWALAAGLIILWCLVGFGPFVIVFKARLLKADVGYLWWIGFVASAGLALFVGCRVAFSTEAVDKHAKKVEQLLWDHLDPGESFSHEIAEPSASKISFLHAGKWVTAFCLMIILGGAQFGCVLLAINDPRVRIVALWLGIGLFFCTLFLLLFLAWLASFFALSHRYHWKARFGITYVNWWLVVCFPIMALAGLGGVRALSFYLFGKLWFSHGEWLLLVTALFILIGAYSVLVLAVVRTIRGWRQTANGEGYFVPPSTRYESLSEQEVGSGVRRLLRRHQLCTWTIFLYLTALWYVLAGYLVVIFFEAVAGSFGAKWALAQSWYWPGILPVEGLSATLQTAVLASLAGAPLSLTVAQAIRGRLNMRRRLKLAQELVRGSIELGLPQLPLEHLKRKLGADDLRVALVPVSGISVRLERTAVFKEQYLLWVSVGAREKLSEKEIESLLWHECGHARFLKQSVWRELIVMLAPWAPRFLDLTDDLYEHERQADLYAVRKMGSEKPLLSALEKLKEEKRLNGDKKQPRGEGRPGRWISWNAVKMIWSLSWAGYLHPDVEQRLRWLEGDKDKSCGTTKPLA